MTGLPESPKNGKQALVIVPTFAEFYNAMLDDGLLLEVTIDSHNQPFFSVGERSYLFICFSLRLRTVPDVDRRSDQLHDVRSKRLGYRFVKK